MNKACQDEVNTCPPCADWPIENLSAEALDLPSYLSIGTALKDPPFGEVWEAQGCLSIVISTVSQADADEQAIAQLSDCVPPPDDPGPNCPECSELYYCEDSTQEDCTSFDCAGSVLSHQDIVETPVYALRPRVDFGYQIPYSGHPGGFMDQVIYLDTPNRFFRYFFEDDSLLRLQGHLPPGEGFGFWTQSAPGNNARVFLLKIGSRWEVNVWTEGTAINVASRWTCLTDTGPPFFDCLTAGCASGLGLDYVTNTTVYSRASVYAALYWLGTGWSIGDVGGCPSAPNGYERACIGACGVVEDTTHCHDKQSEHIRGQYWPTTIRECNGYKPAPDPDNGYFIPCNLRTSVYNAGVGHAVTRQLFEHGIKQECLDSDSPRGTYAPAAGGVRETDCGYTKGIYRPLSTSAIVTLEVPPP